jgi:hypothetical protein
VRYLPFLIVAALLAGCGSSASQAPRRRSSRAPELVFFQRNGGLAATLDTVTVRADGATRADKRYGGAGRRYEDFGLARPLLRRLRGELARLPARAPEAGPGAPRGATYLLCYRGRTLSAEEGAVPRALRPAMGTLNAIVDGAGRPSSVRAASQAPS